MATQQPPYYTLTHFPWSGPGPAPDGYRTWNTVPQQQQTQQGTQQQPNPYLQGSNSMAMATPGPNGQYGVPQWGTPPTGAMASPGAPGGNTVGGYTDPNYSMGPTNGTPAGQGATVLTGGQQGGNPYGGAGTGGGPDLISAWQQNGSPTYFNSILASGPGSQGGQSSQVPDTMQQYGYGNRPGQGGGYYEQQTPAGSFAAANQQNAGVTFAQNPYIGRASAQFGQTNNPYLGGSSGQATAATNPYAGAGNPYTSQYIDQASADAARNYNLYIAPQRDAQMARSGSFGNTGVQQMQLEDQRNLQNTLGGIATTARMNDLAAQQRMGESAADRQTGVSQFNTGMRGTDLNRNMLGTFQGQGMGLQALGLDANLAQQLGLGNAGFANTNSMFNAGQGNAMNMFNVGQGNNMLERFRDRSMMSDQFNQTMDRNIWNDNMGWMRTGAQDMWNNLDKLINWNGQGINAANQQQNTPMDQWLKMVTGAGGLSGQGGTTTGTNNQTMQGNPFMGAIGALLFGNKLFGG